MLTYTSAQISATISSYETKQIGAYVGISNTVLLTIFIYAVAPASGGHINPLITWSAMFSGICPFARGILYLVGQTAGAALAGGLILGSWGEERTMRLNGGGCVFDPAEIGAGRVFLTEVYSSFTLVFLSFGVGLDPRQAVQFGTKFTVRCLWG